ncbi:zinc finger protein 318-like isoform X3 [Paroedura picta]|uniref:zinc finger protein 318-like isoform X3 n=1 Tax=Paroedura picta TaxID=143630 RepID=UPI00405711B2
MERGGWGRVSPPSSSRPKESRGSGSRPSRSAATRGRSPRRSSRVRSPSGGSGSRRGSEQRDGSLSRRLFLGGRPQFASRNDFADFPVYSRHLSCPQSHQRYSSLEGSPPSSFSRRYIKDYHSRKVFVYQSDFNQNCDHLQDISREPDKDGELFRKHLYSLEERGQKQKHPQHDREDRLIDGNIDHHGSLPGKQNYYKRILSRSPTPRYPDEDCRYPENYRSEKNTRQDMPGSSYMIPGLTDSFEPQFFHTPEKAPAMPKKSILKKQVDDPSVQVENFLKCSNKNAVTESAKRNLKPL